MVGRQLTPEELRKVQLLELKVLKEIKRVCTKHDIKYFLTGGTLIGAARHKGFVPWDDDIDIAMMRTEYDRFLKIAPKELGAEYSLLCIQQDPKIGTFFSKVVLNGTTYRNIQHPDDAKYYGSQTEEFEKMKEGLQTNNPGFPGWTSKGFLLNIGISAEVIW